MTISPNGISDIVIRLHSTISSSWIPSYIVGINPDGLVPALQLSKMFKVPLLTLSTDISDCGMSEDAFDGKTNILIVTGNDNEDIMSWIKNDWKKSCYPQSEIWDGVWHNNVRFACVQSNKKDSLYDYVGVIGIREFWWDKF